jgi:hypothetical protein
MPRRVAEDSRELDSPPKILGVQGVRVLDEQVGVEELVGVFVATGPRWLGEAEMDPVIVARDDRVGRRVSPSAETTEPQFVFVIRQGPLVHEAVSD